MTADAIQYHSASNRAVYDDYLPSAGRLGRYRRLRHDAANGARDDDFHILTRAGDIKRDDELQDDGVRAMKCWKALRKALIGADKA